MAARFWVGGAGNWSDTGHWSASSGGASGASKPGVGDTATFDGNSGSGIVTCDEDVNTDSITMGAFVGTFDANGRNITVKTFSGTGTAVRTVIMGSGQWTLTGNATTIWNFGTVTNLTFTRGTNPIVCNYSGATGTRTIAHADTGENSCPSFSITAGTDTIGITNTRLFNLDFTGFSGTLASGTRVLYGSLTFSSGMTLAVGTTTTSFAATSGARTVTTNGQTIPFNMTFGLSASTAVWTLVGAFTMTSDKTLTISFGTLDAATNNVNVTVGLLASASSNTRTINMGSGTWEITGVGTAWSMGTVTGLTLNQGSSTIKFTNSTNVDVTFAGGGKTFNNVWWARGASTGGNIVTGANSYNEFKDTGSVAHTLTMPNSTSTVTTWTVVGSSGNVITIARTGASGQFTLSKSSGAVNMDYVSISNGIGTGGASWYAGANSTDGGNNRGFQFSKQDVSRANFFNAMS